MCKPIPFAFVFLTLTLLLGCSRQLSPDETIREYFAAAQAGDEALFMSLVTDEIAKTAPETFKALEGYYNNADVKIDVVESFSIGSDAHEIKIRMELLQGTKSKASVTQIVQLVKREGRWLLAKNGTSRDSANQIEADKAGKKPQDYTMEYYSALNAGDMDKVFSLYSPGYYAAQTADLRTKETDPKRLAIHTNWISKKTDSVVIDHGHCGFHKTNAEGVYSVAVTLTLSDSYLNERKASGLPPMPKASGSELCFKLTDGLWKITSKTNGE